MNRRAFLSLSAITPFANLLPVNARDDEKRKERELKADVVIIGAGVGGIACALAAARNGLKVILTSEHDWIGGQLTSQAVPPDEHPWIEQFGCTKTYRTFREKVRDFYRRNYPLTDAAQKATAFNPGNGTVSKLCHEPRAALIALLEMLTPYLSSGKVRLLRGITFVVKFTKDRADAIDFWEYGPAFNDYWLQAPYFVDATEEGRLISEGEMENVTGAESRKDTDEPHAPAKANPQNFQAFTYCFAMDYLDGEDHTIEKPKEYAFWRDYVPKLNPAWMGKLLSWRMTHPITLEPRDMGFDPTGPTPKGVPNLWTYRRIADRKNFAPGTYPGDVCLVNWPQNDYLLGTSFWLNIDDAPSEHSTRAKQLSLSLLYWMQTEAPRPDGKQGWKGLRLRPDVVGTDDGLAQAPYIRESRRIKADFTVTENHVGTEARAKLTGKKPGEFTAEKFKDSVGVGSYRIDLHPSTGGDNYIDVSSLPFQIPLGALIPVRVENLLPACKNIGTTHITNGCYRLHPVEWNIGEAVGELVAFCLAKKVPPRKVRNHPKLLADFQAGLVKAGFELDWPDTVAKTPR
jgi:hypothetical protein